MLCRSGRRIDVVLARDADDTDVTEAFAAALLTSGAVTLPSAQVGHTQALCAGVDAFTASATGWWLTLTQGMLCQQAGARTPFSLVELRNLPTLTLHMCHAD